MRGLVHKWNIERGRMLSNISFIVWRLFFHSWSLYQFIVFLATEIPKLWVKTLTLLKKKFVASFPKFLTLIWRAPQYWLTFKKHRHFFIGQLSLFRTKNTTCNAFIPIQNIEELFFRYRILKSSFSNKSSVCVGNNYHFLIYIIVYSDNL